MWGFGQNSVSGTAYKPTTQMTPTPTPLQHPTTTLIKSIRWTPGQLLESILHAAIQHHLHAKACCYFALKPAQYGESPASTPDLFLICFPPIFGHSTQASLDRNPQFQNSNPSSTSKIDPHLKARSIQPFVTLCIPNCCHKSAHRGVKWTLLNELLNEL